MYTLAALVPLALAALANALPPAGTYNIVNRVLSAGGQQLAITFEANNAAVTLQPFVSPTEKSQIFNLKVYSALGMSVTPQSSTAQQLAPSADPDGRNATYIVSKAPGGSVYNIVDTAAGYLIGNALANSTRLWVPADTAAGAKIGWDVPPGAGSDRQFWLLVPSSG